MNLPSPKKLYTSVCLRLFLHTCRGSTHQGKAVVLSYSPLFPLIYTPLPAQDHETSEPEDKHRRVARHLSKILLPCSLRRAAYFSHFSRVTSPSDISTSSFQDFLWNGRQRLLSVVGHSTTSLFLYFQPHPCGPLQHRRRYYPRIAAVDACALPLLVFAHRLRQCPRPVAVATGTPPPSAPAHRHR